MPSMATRRCSAVRGGTRARLRFSTKGRWCWVRIERAGGKMIARGWCTHAIRAGPSDSSADPRALERDGYTLQEHSDAGRTGGRAVRCGEVHVLNRKRRESAIDMKGEPCGRFNARSQAGV